ncbi:F-box/LRR-repeat protein [Acrasis kona]|uniref:F-box/LRR-repeat protein n=1 Tax=Acrasis kona TaxID=1008807 RepID=A0AAW2ZNZ6_9EUKA
MSILDVMDVLSIIVMYLDTPTWIKFSYTCQLANSFKHNQQLMDNKEMRIKNLEVYYQTFSPPKKRLIDIFKKQHKKKAIQYNTTLKEIDVPITPLLFIRSLDLSYNFTRTRVRILQDSSIINLNVSGCYYLDCSDLSCLTQLESLKADGTCVTDAVLSTLTNLRKLSVSACRDVTCDTFLHMSKLQDLNISFCQGITDKGFENLSNITKLNMSGCVLVSNESLEFIKNVRVLSLRQCKQITDVGLCHLSKVVDLNIAGCNLVTDVGICHLDSVKTLILDGCGKLTDKALSPLGGVRRLSVRNCVRLTDACLDHLHYIQFLDVSDCYQISQKSLSKLSFCSVTKKC